MNRRFVVCLSWTSDGEQGSLGRPGPSSPSCDGEQGSPWTLQSNVCGLKAPNLLHESPCCSFYGQLKCPTSVKVSIALVLTSEWYQTQTACAHSFSVLFLHLSDHHTRQSKTVALSLSSELRWSSFQCALRFRLRQEAIVLKKTHKTNDFATESASLSLMVVSGNHWRIFLNSELPFSFIFHDFFKRTIMDFCLWSAIYPEGKSFSIIVICILLLLESSACKMMSSALKVILKLCVVVVVVYMPVLIQIECVCVCVQKVKLSESLLYASFDDDD